MNAFVRSALSQCAAGDYDAFRRLWTARQEPLPRAEFEEAWQAVDRIEVQALEQARLTLKEDAEPEPVYVLLVEVSLDPRQKPGQRRPVRDIVLVLLNEHGSWRLGRAPKAMREWVKQRIQGQEATPRPDQPTP